MYDSLVNLSFAPPFSANRLVTTPDTRMAPISFGTCFGWLHFPAINSPVATGIILCATLGQEARHVHRQWRILADSLAAQGHVVLRFDYPETGDSWGEPGNPVLEAWIESIRQAVGILQERGIADITLLGLRFGATLAALAQARLNQTGGVDHTSDQLVRPTRRGQSYVNRLIMLAPVISGRLYIRELRMLARISGGRRLDSHDDLEAGGLQLDAATCRAIATIDLRREMKGPGGPILILDPADIYDCDALAAVLREREGRCVTTAPFDDLIDLLRNAHTNSFPTSGFAQISRWLDDTTPAIVPPRVFPPRVFPPGVFPPGVFPPGLVARRGITAGKPNMPNDMSDGQPPELILHPPGARERPCHFGPNGHLFGMLCEPETAPLVGADIVVVICNNGSNPHYGHGRFAVTFGRDMAQAGIASFRMDFAGLGDSPAGHLVGRSGERHEERPHLFDASRDPDIKAALDALERFGYRRFVLTGICAGAYHAFHGALADRRVVAIYGVNLPKFRWPVGDDPDEVIAQSLHATSYYLDEIRRLETWRRLLRNDINVSAVSRALVRRLGRRIATSLIMPLALRFGSASGPGFPRWAVSALSRRGVRVHLLYGHDDPGVEELVRCFGMGGRKLARLPGCSVEIPDDVDHAISYSEIRQALQRRFLTFIQSVISDGAGPVVG